MMRSGPFHPARVPVAVQTLAKPGAGADRGGVATYVVIAAGPWDPPSSSDARPVVGELFGVTRDGAMGRPVIASVPRADLRALEDDIRRDGRRNDEARSLSRLAFRHLGADVARGRAVTGSLVELVGEEALEVPVDLLEARRIIREYQLAHYLPGDTIGEPFDGP